MIQTEKKETKVRFCVMCGDHAGYKDPEHNEPLCIKCFKINEDIRIKK